MSWSGPNISFWLITAMVVMSAAYATFAKSILRAAFSLFFTLFGMAGYYVLLGSDFIAVMQVIIYVGGILVLLVFGVLLTNRPWPSPVALSRKTQVVFSVPVLLLSAVVFYMISQARWIESSSLGIPAYTVRELGKLFLGRYLLSLEIAGLTLLLCLVGAAHLLRRRER